MSIENPYTIDQDYSATTADFAPTSGRLGGTPASNQAGRAALFKSATGTFSLANLDANANVQTSAVSPGGAPLSVYTGQSTPVAASQYGALCMGRQVTPAPSNYQPLLIDSQGALITAGQGKPTFRTTATGVTCATNKVLLSIFNAGSNFVRIASINIYVQSQGTVAVNGGTVLGLTGTSTTTTYSPVFCEMYRISSHTKGGSTSQLSPSACDTSDSADSLVTTYSNSTISASLGLLHRRDALQSTNTGTEYYRVICTTERNITCRPGEGIAVVCVSNGTISANTNNGTTTATVDVSATYTLAAA